MLDKLRAEWPTITAAPWSMATIAALSFVAGMAVITALTGHEIASLKADRDLYKHQAEADPSQLAASSTSAPQASPGRVVAETVPRAPAPPNSSDFAPQAVAQRYIGLVTERATDLQVDQLLRPYIGKRIRVPAVLVSAEQRADGIQVELTTARGNGCCYFVSFEAKWAAQLAALPVGSQITIDALIADDTPPKLKEGQIS